MAWWWSSPSCCVEAVYLDHSLWDFLLNYFGTLRNLRVLKIFTKYQTNYPNQRSAYKPASQPASPLASHPTPITSPINRIFSGLCSLFTSNHGASEFTFYVNCMCLSVYSKRPNQVVRLSSNPYRTMKLNPNGYVIHNFRGRLYILSTNILIFTHFQSTITCKLRTAKQLF